MNRMNRIVAWALVMSATAIQIGCCSQCGKPFCFDRCADIPKGAIPAPLGTYNCGWQNVHTNLADRNLLTIYRSEWIGETTELGPFGQRHVAEIPKQAAQLGEPIVVELSGDRDLDESRRRAVVEQLAAQGISDADQWVTINYASAEAAYAIEAPRNVSSYISGSNTSQGRGNFGRNSTVGFGF